MQTAAGRGSFVAVSMQSIHLNQSMHVGFKHAASVSDGEFGRLKQ